MDVRLPDGTVIRDVPDGMSKSDLVAKLKANGYDTSELEPKPGLFTPGNMTDDEVMKEGLRMGPVGNFMSNIPGRATELVTGLAARGADALGANDAAEMLRKVGAMRPTGFDGDSYAAKGGALAADTLLAGKAAELGGALITGAGRVVPALSKITDPLGRAVGTFGAQSGLPASGARNAAIDLATRSVGAGGAGYLGAQVTDPENATAAAAISAAIPVVSKIATVAGNTAADVVRPFTSRGREQIAGEVLRNAAQNPSAVAAKMSQPQNSYAPLTLAERTMDPGLASLQRTIANDPKIGPELTAFLERQNAARTGVLLGMVQGPNAPGAIRSAREAATGPAYTNITQQYGDELLNTMGVRRAAANIAQTPRFRTEAVAREVQNAVADNPSLGIQRFGTSDSGWRREAPMVDMWGARQNIDQRLYGGGGLDAKASAQAASGELSRLRSAMSTQLDKIPGFKDVEKIYAQYSRRADAADLIFDIAKKGTANTADMMGNPVASAAKLTQALKSIDAKDWANLSKEQRGTIVSLAQELRNAAKAFQLSKALGSNTVQNALADNNVRMAIKGAAGILPGGGLLQSAMGAGTAGAQEKVMGLLGQAIMDPAYAARLASNQTAPALTPALQALMARSGAVVPGLLAVE